MIQGLCNVVSSNGCTQARSKKSPRLPLVADPRATTNTGNRVLLNTFSVALYPKTKVAFYPKSETQLIGKMQSVRSKRDTKFWSQPDKLWLKKIVARKLLGQWLLFPYKRAVNIPINTNSISMDTIEPFSTLEVTHIYTK